ncbi:LysR family transcriptional regulator [Kordiimonas aquimaris]|uniref:LysR family transcriptional regulator n=1 Tax=Kordiimonas aquimaris TaxID=707591 RepID=UPI0021D3AFB2|nr:LysR family transcriptional regulator [Kordiimonas aquimaris]
MNWSSVSFDWNQARAFLATVEEGSLSAAARQLGLTQPTLGRQVSALEEALDVVLFERIGKSLVLTPSGIELSEHVRAMYEAASRMSLTASGQSQTIEGKVNITASDIMSAYILPPALKQLRETAPLIEINVVATNDIRDLQLREADIAVRHVRPEQPDLIAKLIGDGAGAFYASKQYLDKYGRPETEDDLSDHDFIGFGDNTRMIDALNQMGLKLSKKNFRVGSASGLVAWEMARNGLGIIVMSNNVGDTTHDMERVLPNRDPMLFPIWLTAHRELYTSRRIRLTFDLLADFLSKEM